jgi:hypothetical protein
MEDWRARLAFLLANLFPSPAYMQQRYALPGRLVAPLAYPYRWGIGIKELLASRRETKRRLAGRAGQSRP